uniref:glutathione transferase n=1 Tax=Hirondellea gigas TaxID=1518452 RepID=A0A2P2I1R4_9CRUS
MAPLLAYWDIRGLAQPIRLLLEYTNTKFTDKYYVCGEAPGYDKSCWFDVKSTLGFDFPNLPYYTDGDLKLTESGAIIRHIARKHDLCGKTEEERCRVDMLAYIIESFRSTFVRLCYGQGFDEAKLNYLEGLDAKLKSFVDFLGDRKWFAGDDITYPDFIVFEIFDQHLIMESDCLKKFPTLEQFHQRFLELPAIKAYLASPRCITKRLNNRMANFGSGVEEEK